ncbi:hypothetical protein SISNIDRAFT_469956 [Sistotremastrum niveocremeum HHB9708]|uniref:Arrestin-like N-terminal domain-containing protein n=1 Tax=Sistotremastrum niveocremeum HHB9708 TaxID=1314777 RepID=A0A164PFU3_9AGAM|nr:hypothetical protein SISNIDRAFT_469956 [Sistotremastrum niveocremeum HHB9708]
MFHRNSPPPASSLHFTPGLRTPDGDIRGIVSINLHQASLRHVHQVKIEYYVTLKTLVSYKRGDPSMTSRYREVLYRREKTIWESPNPASPSSSSAEISIPFSFSFPSDRDLPPSFNFQETRITARVRHGVSLYEYRRGHSQSFVEGRSFRFLPLDNPPAMRIEQLPRRFYSLEKDLRHWFDWHGGRVEVKSCMPDLHAIPLLQSIPISVHIRCLSGNLPNASRSTFPRLPNHASDIHLKLQCIGKVRAGPHEEEFKINYHSISGFGDPHIRSNAEVTRPLWIPNSDGVSGRWSREAVFHTNIFLCAGITPSFRVKSGHLSITHQLKLKIPFSGLGNDFKMVIPVRVSSGVYQGIPPPYDLVREMLPPYNEEDDGVSSD